MGETEHRLRFWGVRGSVCTPSPENLRYGGNTSCLSIDLGGGRHFVLDAGTGLRPLGAALGAERRRVALEVHLFLTHYHLDHIQGLPFFAPLFDSNTRITLYGARLAGRSCGQILRTLVAPPYFPLALSELPGEIGFVTLRGSPVALGDLLIDALPLNHPGGASAYRLRRGDRHIVYATDHEHGDRRTDAALAQFSRNARALIYDAAYDPSEYKARRRGWGHSTWQAGLGLARAARAKSLVLFHHGPDMSDERLDATLQAARREASRRGDPRVIAAREGMELAL